MTTYPTTVKYYENGQIHFQSWYINGLLHNENGPAHIYYYKSGQISYQSWNINGIVRKIEPELFNTL